MGRHLLVTRWPVLLAGCLLLAAGCVPTDSSEVRGPTAGDSGPLATFDAEAPGELPGDDAPPTVVLDTPELLGPHRARLSGTASDDRGVVALTVRIGAGGPIPVEDAGDGFARFALEVDVAGGPVEFEVVAYDAGGRAGTATAHLDAPVPADVLAPDLTIDSPMSGVETNAATVVLTGTASDAEGVVSVEISGDRAGPLGVARTGDAFAHWALVVPVAADGLETFTARAVDAAGNATERRVDVLSRAAPAGDPPLVVIDSPLPGTELATTRTRLVVRISSDAPVEAAAVRVDDGPWQPLEDVGGLWVAQLTLVPGFNQLVVVARDADGLMGRAVARVTVEDGWDAGDHVLLRGPGEPGGRVALDLDREGVAALFPEDLQRETVLLQLDPRPMIAAALAQIRNGCGEGWSRRDFEPDCPDSWGAPERNLWSLLIMSPRTTNVTGTPLERSAIFADDAFPRGLLPVDFAGLLAASLQIPVDEPVLSTDVVVETLVSSLIATHPGAGPGGLLPVTLADGLADMATLAERFGPVGEHPGFLAPPVRGVVLTEAFRMRLVLESNLRFFEGLRLASGRKDYFADVPAGDPVVELDFESAERFSIEGLVENPVASLGFVMLESPEVAVPGDGPDPRPRGGSNVWSFPPWTLERIVAEAAFAQFGDLRTGCDLCAGLAAGAFLYLYPEIGSDLVEIAIGTQGYDCPVGGPCTNGLEPTPRGTPEHFELMADPPAGWFRLWIPQGLVSTPPPMYIWELFLYVAQARLRDDGVAEGEGSARFDLEDVTVGLDPATLEAGLRAELHRQRATLAERLLGSYASGNGQVDVFVDRAADGRLWLLAATCALPLPGDCQASEDMGFFRNPELRDPADERGPRGLRGIPLSVAGVGTVLYARVPGAPEEVRRIEIEGLDAAGVTLWVRGPR